MSINTKRWLNHQLWQVRRRLVRGIRQWEKTNRRNRLWQVSIAFMLLAGFFVGKLRDALEYRVPPQALATYAPTGRALHRGNRSDYLTALRQRALLDSLHKLGYQARENTADRVVPRSGTR